MAEPQGFRSANFDPMDVGERFSVQDFITRGNDGFIGILDFDTGHFYAHQVKLDSDILAGKTTESQKLEAIKTYIQNNPSLEADFIATARDKTKMLPDSDSLRDDLTARANTTLQLEAETQKIHAANADPRHATEVFQHETSGLKKISDATADVGRKLGPGFAAVAGVAVFSMEMMGGATPAAAAEQSVTVLDGGTSAVELKNGNVAAAVEAGVEDAGGIVGTIIGTAAGVYAGAQIGVSGGGVYGGIAGALVGGFVGSGLAAAAFPDIETNEFFNTVPALSALPADAPQDLKEMAKLKEEIMPIDAAFMELRMTQDDPLSPEFFTNAERKEALSNELDLKMDEFKIRYTQMKDEGQLPQVKAVIAQATAEIAQAQPENEASARFCAAPKL